jgi:thiamine-phosphate pyrophosphorylase
MKKNASWRSPLCADTATRHIHFPDLRLYLITDSRLFSTPCAFYFGVEDALSGGAKSVQLREKDISTRELLETAYWMRDLTREYNALLFINDRVDIALAAEADGVHLGQDSLPPEAARKIGGKNLLIGASCHNLGEAVAAEQSGADFLTIGPVYETPLKMKYGDPVGIGELVRVKSNVSIPVLAIGGIKLPMVKEVIHAGADGIALISGVLAAKNITETTGEFMRLLS